MKIKQLRQVVAGLFPAQFAPVFSRAYTAKEIALVADAIKVAAQDAHKREFEFMESNAHTMAKVTLLESKLSVLEEHLEREEAANKVAIVRDPPSEEVVLIDVTEVQSGADPTVKYKNKIGLIKAVREVTNLGLREAKDLVEDVMDRGFQKSVFRGPTDKAAVAVRVLSAAGGVTARKEAF